MKFLVVFALIAAVATASPIKPALVTEELSQIYEIINAINSPNTDPATAQLLEAMLLEYLGLSPAAVGPAIIEDVNPVIGVGPTLIDDEIVAPGPVAPGPVAPGPVVEGPAAPKRAPLVQLIVNVNAQGLDGVDPVGVIGPDSVVAPPAPVIPSPVIVVDESEGPIVPAPVVLPEPVLPEVIEPIQVAEPVLPGGVEPIQVAEPVLPVMPEIDVSPVNLPDTLN